MSRTLELPDSVYEALLEAAGARGIAPVDWIAERLPLSQSQAEAASLASGQNRQDALDRLLQHTVSLGRPTGADNELIDTDLAREYAASHQVPSDQGRT